MNKILLVLICLATACSKEYTDEQPRPISERSSRSEGNVDCNSDGSYAVLGLGYDITEDYLNPSSVRARVLDIDRYEKEFANRIVTHTNSWQGDFVCVGATAEDYLQELTKKANCGTTIGDITKVSAFPGTFSSREEFNDSYSYCSKYSFASMDCIHNQGAVYLNDDLERLSQYLSPQFIEDLELKSAQQLIETYGTHVPTDIALGGRYRLMYRSCAVKSTDKSARTAAVTAGFDALLKKIGIKLDAGGETGNKEISAKENLSEELWVYLYEGSGFTLKYSLDSKTPTANDIQNWNNTLTGTSRLTGIKWEKAYPLSDFISDPTKKEAVRAAIDKYIADKQIKTMQLIPFYEMWYSKAKDTYYTFSWEKVLLDQTQGRQYRVFRGYLLAEPSERTLPLYAMWYGKSADTYYLTSKEAVRREESKGRQCIGIVGYILKDPAPNTSPLYYMWYQKNKDTFFALGLEEVALEVKNGREMQGMIGYLYNLN